MADKRESIHDFAAAVVAAGGVLPAVGAAMTAENLPDRYTALKAAWAAAVIDPSAAKVRAAEDELSWALR